ncbi:GrpB family protein [Labedella endophytica]|nr:GrpB family protein [Labedella endophytica]
MTTHPLWLSFAAEANARRQGQRIADRQTPPGPVREHDARWRDDFIEVGRLIADTIGDQVIEIRHVGSTAVPGLAAKPVIDIDLTVPDVEDEGAYLPPLEAAGFRLIFRDAMAGDPHRHLTLARPNTNLHVWSPGAVEPLRHALFTEWLGANASDRERYGAAKTAAVEATGGERYNDLKAAAVYDIYERAFLADPFHHHDPQPRPGLPASVVDGNRT